MNHLFSRLFNPARGMDASCITLPDGTVRTYGDVDRDSARYAATLKALGVKPGDRVAVQVEKSVDAILLYLGCIRSGAVFLPLNTAYTRNEVGYFLKDAEPVLFVARPEDSEEMRACAAENGVPRVETLGADGTGTLAGLLVADAAGWEDVARGPADLAAIVYTSGTTGRSKGAMLTHDNLRSNAEALVASWRFTEADVLIHALPIFHVHGLFIATNVSLMAGATMIFLPKFVPSEVVGWMPRATALMGVPTFYTRLLAEEGLAQAASGMRLFVSGSAPLLAETHVEFSRVTGHAILERYGMTETGMNSSNPYEGERIPGSVGPALPGVQLRVADPETGAILETDQVGVVEISGPNVFSGYWRMPEKTQQEFRDGYFISGDVGRIDGNGYLWILGRAKDLVITGGYNVYPKEVETEIDAVEGVLESAVIGVPHADLGEGVTAVVVRKAGATVGEPEILAALNGRLARYKQPKRVVFVDELPRNTMAKVQKNVLREQFKGIYGGS